MKIIWLGHASFRLEIGDQVLLIDPWLSGNPMLPADRHQEATQGATHILLTHGHFDHISDTLPLAKENNIPVVGQYDLIGHWMETEEIEGIGFNKGGTVFLAMWRSPWCTQSTVPPWAPLRVRNVSAANAGL